MLLQAPGVLFIHPLAELTQLRHQCFIAGVFRDGVAEGAEAHQQIPFGATALQHLFQHREPGSDSALLTHQLHPKPRRTAAFPLTERFFPCQHLQQGGFAGAIGTDQSEPLPFTDVEIEIGKEGADAEILGRTHQADQTHGVPAGS